ncbi:MAG TPA: ABC transporter substrate-binding protein [Candidatus Limnocylindria bacterium]|nr:ABC transporter substrate-binding protein [Candidatus Limnocylindria bacterium]
MSRARSVIVILVALGLALAACTGVQQSPTPEVSDGDGATPTPAASGGGTATGGTVRVAVGGYPDSLNPGNGVLAESYTMYELVYDTPIAVNSNGDYVPELATEWSVSDDGLTWTLTLVEGATFHDGEPVTAADVVYSVELYRDTEDFPFLPSYAAPFVEVEATDERTVVLTTEEPINTFEPYLAFLYILPQHVWEAEDDPVAFENAEMIGSGPFKLVEASQGEFIQLEANTDYWTTPANVDGVIFQTYSNADARVQALTTGEVDAITEFPATAVSTLQNTDGVTVHVADIAAGGSFRDYFFNVVSDEDCPEEDGVCSGHPALKDVNVRRALAHAVDKQQIIDVATLGTGSPGLSVVPPGLGDYYASEVQDYAFDVAEANRLLDEAGYEDTDGDGIRECLADQDCETLTFRFHYADDIDSAPREAELLQAMWGEIGVAIEIQGLDPDALTSVCCPTFDYDIILWGWGSDPDPGFLLGVALCSEIPTGFSETGYCNPEYDELYDAQFIEQDRDARVDMVHEMQQILVDDVPYIIPYYQVSIQAWREDNFIGWLADDPTFGLADPSWLLQLRPSE